MPRGARLDSPGMRHHVIIREIERRRIVDDERSFGAEVAEGEYRRYGGDCGAGGERDRYPLAEAARALGVSTSVVSKVLRKRGG